MDEQRQSVTVKQGADGARYMTLVTTNGYKDREKEWLSTDALTDWVDKQWDGQDFASDNKLDFWHVDPTIGDLVWADMQGTFLTEVYKERQSGMPFIQAYTTAIWDYLEKQDSYGASHLFIYDPDRVEDTDDGRVFHAIDKRRSTALPLEFAANPFTFSGVINMTDTQKEKRDGFLDNLFGPEFAGTLRSMVGRAEDKLDKAGIEHKAIGPTVTKADLQDAVLVSTKEAIKAAVKANEEGQAETELQDIVAEVLEALMTVPSTNVEDYTEILDVDDDDDADDTIDTPEPAPNNDAVDELKALATSAMKAYEDVTADNAALLETQQALVEALKALSGMPEAVTVMAQRITKMEKQLAHRPKRASRAAETDAEVVAPDLLEDLEKAASDNGDNVTFFGYEAKGS